MTKKQFLIITVIILFVICLGVIVLLSSHEHNEYKADTQKSIMEASLEENDATKETTCTSSDIPYEAKPYYPIIDNECIEQKEYIGDYSFYEYCD